jgi:Zn-dependent protease
MSRWEYLVPLVVVLVLSMMLHEIAHGYAAYRLGDPTAKSRGRLTLNPLRHLDLLGTAMFIITYLSGSFIFGWAKPVPVSPYYFKNRQKGMAIVGICGPLTNFAIAVVFWAVLMLLRGYLLVPNPDNVRVAVFTIVFLAFEVNVVLGIFNLIPIPPLDGSRVLGAFLPRRAYQYWAGIDRYSSFILIGLLIVIAYSGLSRTLQSGYDALWHLVLPDYF